MNEETRKFKIRRDRFMSARGGTSAFYNIYCVHCRKWLLLYQKDGKGNLFRLYLDRIHAPENLALICFSSGKTTKFPGLVCSHCGVSIGVPMIYKREARPAFRLVPGAIVKQQSDGTLPAPQNPDE
ncbi:MAG: hypothetical protein DDT32_01874 [Syntrophomonadaceae bacterium]|nr:hypothetical protein [Bacillota bacterium]MBT9148104.1 hypothetical protein [Bacillota bacterium]